MSAHVLLNLLMELRKSNKIQGLLSYTSAHILLNLLNELRASNKMRGLLSIFFAFSQRVS